MADPKYFSLIKAKRLAGRDYRTCVCYPLTEDFKPTILSLVAVGEARLHEEKVIFMNGAIKDTAKATEAAAATETASRGQKKSTVQADAEEKL